MTVQNFIQRAKMKFIGGHKAKHHVVTQAAEIMMGQNDHKKHALKPYKVYLGIFIISHPHQCLYIISGSQHSTSHKRGYLY